MKIAKAAHASGFVNAILRRAARERGGADRGAARRRLDPRGRRGRPLGAALAGADVVGGARRRGGARRCSPPATSPPRWRCGRADAEARADLVARLRGEGVDVSPAAGPWPLDVAEAMVFAGRTGDSVLPLVEEGALTPQSRGSAAVVEVLAPRAGETVLDLCAGPGIKTGQIADPDGGPRRGDLGRARRGARRRDRRPGPPPRPPRRHRLRGRRDLAAAAEGFDRILLDAPCSDLGTLASRPDARWRKSPRTIERVAAVQEKALRERGEAAGARRHAGLLDLHDLPARERGPDRRAAGGDRRRPGPGAGAGRPRRPRARASPRRTSRAPCSCAPIATAPPASSSPDYAGRPTDPASLNRCPMPPTAAAASSTAPLARAAASPGCARPSCPAACAASTA